MADGDVRSGGSFWDHLDALRSVLVRSVIVTTLFACVAFVFKEQLFAIVLAPGNSHFIAYRMMARLAAFWGAAPPAPFELSLINAGLAQQFMIHLKTAFCAGLLCASPYVLFELFRFVAPALYSAERRVAIGVAAGGYVMFVVGVAVSYFLVFPLTVRFLGEYQVAANVPNLITLESYMSTLILLTLAMGIVFEMPVVAWMLARLGLVTPSFMRRYRRHAIVVIVVAAAIITPTSDAFTLLVVSLPMWMLYELSIFIVTRASRPSARPDINIFYGKGS